MAHPLLLMGMMESQRLRAGGGTDWSSLIEYAYIVGESAATAPAGLALNTWSTSPEDGDGLFPVTVATLGSVAHGLASDETFDIRRSTSALLYNGAADSLPSAYQAAVRLSSAQASVIGSTLTMVEKRESVANLGSAGALPLTAASNAVSPRLLATPDRLEFDGSDDLTSAVIPVGSISSYYLAFLYRVSEAQTDTTQRVVMEFESGNLNRLIVSQGSFGGAGTRLSVWHPAGFAADEYINGVAVAGLDTDLAIGDLYLCEFVAGASVQPANFNLRIAGRTSALIRSKCGFMGIWLGTSDISTQVRAYAAAQGVSFP
jgi:hypothetical protein